MGIDNKLELIGVSLKTTQARAAAALDRITQRRRLPQEEQTRISDTITAQLKAIQETLRKSLVDPQKIQLLQLTQGQIQQLQRWMGNEFESQCTFLKDHVSIEGKRKDPSGEEKTEWVGVYNYQRQQITGIEVYPHIDVDFSSDKSAMDTMPVSLSCMVIPEGLHDANEIKKFALLKAESAHPLPDRILLKLDPSKGLNTMNFFKVGSWQDPGQTQFNLYVSNVMGNVS